MGDFEAFDGFCPPKCGAISTRFQKATSLHGNMSYDAYILSKSVKRLVTFFWKMAAVTIWTRGAHFGVTHRGLYHCAKFGWNHWSSLNMTEI